MKRNIIRAALLFFVFFIIISLADRNSHAITLTVNQNIGEYDFYDFDFNPITESTLSFDYNFTTVEDPSDPSDPFAFLDSFYCDITIDSFIYPLLIVDSFDGSIPDPDGVFPGTVTVNTSITPEFENTLTADISSFIGLSGNIYFEVSDWGDIIYGGIYMGDSYDTTAVIGTITGITPSQVPEPSVIFLLGSLFLGVFWVNRRFLAH